MHHNIAALKRIATEPTILQYFSVANLTDICKETGKDAKEVYHAIVHKEGQYKVISAICKSILENC